VETESGEEELTYGQTMHRLEEITGKKLDFTEAQKPGVFEARKAFLDALTAELPTHANDPKRTEPRAMRDLLSPALLKMLRAAIDEEMNSPEFKAAEMLGCLQSIKGPNLMGQRIAFPVGGPSASGKTFSGAKAAELALVEEAKILGLSTEATETHTFFNLDGGIGRNVSVIRMALLDFDRRCGGVGLKGLGKLDKVYDKEYFLGKVASLPQIHLKAPLTFTSTRDRNIIQAVAKTHFVPGGFHLHGAVIRGTNDDAFRITTRVQGGSRAFAPEPEAVRVDGSFLKRHRVYGYESKAPENNHDAGVEFTKKTMEALASSIPNFKEITIFNDRTVFVEITDPNGVSDWRQAVGDEPLKGQRSVTAGVQILSVWKLKPKETRGDFVDFVKATRIPPKIIVNEDVGITLPESKTKGGKALVGGLIMNAGIASGLNPAVIKKAIAVGQGVADNLSERMTAAGTPKSIGEILQSIVRGDSSIEVVAPQIQTTPAPKPAPAPVVPAPIEEDGARRSTAPRVAKVQDDSAIGVKKPTPLAVAKPKARDTNDLGPKVIAARPAKAAPVAPAVVDDAFGVATFVTAKSTEAVAATAPSLTEEQQKALEAKKKQEEADSQLTVKLKTVAATAPGVAKVVKPVEVAKPVVSAPTQVSTFNAPTLMAVLPDGKRVVDSVHSLVPHLIETASADANITELFGKYPKKVTADLLNAFLKADPAPTPERVAKVFTLVSKNVPELLENDRLLQSFLPATMDKKERINAFIAIAKKQPKVFSIGNLEFMLKGAYGEIVEPVFKLAAKKPGLVFKGKSPLDKIIASPSELKRLTDLAGKFSLMPATQTLLEKLKVVPPLKVVEVAKPVTAKGSFTKKVEAQKAKAGPAQNVAGA
jgi:hypothetical protein